MAVGFSASNSFADFTLFDNFDGYAPGAYLAGQGPAGNLWTMTPMNGASPTGMVTRADSGGLATFVGPTGASAAYRGLGPAGLTIGNSSTATTVFWQFRINQSAVNNNWNFVLTDVNPSDTAGSSEVQFNFDSTAANTGGLTTFRARNGANFKFLSTSGAAVGDVPVVPDSLYSVWLVVNNSADNYSIYLQNDSIGALSGSAHQVFADDGSGGVFTFRNGAAANDLINVNFGSGSGQYGQTVFDNIYIDPSGQNLSVAVPEPTSLSLVGLGAAAALFVSRRRVA
ncbi:MAG TPA: PEP-CTERM sorting domain-containing protein [Bacillota bacterium]|nr:PEP-CTERM sorting domain-containing protein [Bacillota bacterium]